MGVIHDGRDAKQVFSFSPGLNSVCSQNVKAQLIMNVTSVTSDFRISNVVFANFTANSNLTERNREREIEVIPPELSSQQWTLLSSSVIICNQQSKSQNIPDITITLLSDNSLRTVTSCSVHFKKLDIVLFIYYEGAHTGEPTGEHKLQDMTVRPPVVLCL